LNRLNVVLLLALIASAMVLVRTSYDSRREFAELDRLQTEQRRLDVDYQRLLTERQGEATNLRVERVAREKLRMSPATPAVTQYVTDDKGGAK
jgi:cell division protein FtsL